jgi:hypothetical protein
MNASIAKRIAPLLMGSALLGASLASHAASPCESARLKAWFDDQRAMTDGVNTIAPAKPQAECTGARADKTADASASDKKPVQAPASQATTGGSAR